MENLISDLEDKMQKTIASLNNEFKKIRTGRANPSMLDDIKIDYYGSPTPINQAASISVEEGRTLTISPWDKSLIEDIEKAIMKSDLGLNPNTSGDLIRLTMPVLTEETRGDYIKQAKNEAENAKIVLLSGTPIINYPNEIGVMFNILRGFIKTWDIIIPP